MKACLEKAKACVEKTKAEIDASQKEVRTQIKTGLEEMKATELEANKEKTGDGMEHYNPVPHAEAAHFLRPARLGCRCSAWCPETSDV
jgi:hypothetical protein